MTPKELWSAAWHGLLAPLLLTSFWVVASVVMAACPHWLNNRLTHPECFMILLASWMACHLTKRGLHHGH